MRLESSRQGSYRRTVWPSARWMWRRRRRKSRQYAPDWHGTVQVSGYERVEADVQEGPEIWEVEGRHDAGFDETVVDKGDVEGDGAVVKICNAIGSSTSPSLTPQKTIHAIDEFHHVPSDETAADKPANLFAAPVALGRKEISCSPQPGGRVVGRLRPEIGGAQCAPRNRHRSCGSL
ncbi:hypothetical protein LY76DRAFT_293674 [Colletotrichum caudatum]|nr:hypothetical protein LY76DRAFT_293674 [Colletotrichum caudatum]